MSSRFLHLILPLAFIVLILILPAPAEACCGESPDYYFTAFVDNPPSCTYRSNSYGQVTWRANYDLHHSSHIAQVHIFGDGVITKSIPHPLEHVPGQEVTTVTYSETWQWDPAYIGTRTVRVQIDLSSWDDYIDGAMIRITCTSRGLYHYEVENWEGHFLPTT